MLSHCLQASRKRKNRPKQKFPTCRILVSCRSASRKKVKVGSYLLFYAGAVLSMNDLTLENVSITTKYVIAPIFQGILHTTHYKN